MAIIRHLFFITALFTIIAAVPGNRVEAQIQGQFDTIGVVPPPHSLEVVSWDEFLNFTCPHCNNFRTAYLPLKEKYGDRVRFRIVPVLFRGQSDAAVRLFFVGRKAGREEEIKTMIFDATFKYGVNINDPAIVLYLAKSAGLGSEYEKEAHSEWVNNLIQQSSELIERAGITSTPTVVLANSIRVSPGVGMGAFVKNLVQIIDQLLKTQ